MTELGSEFNFTQLNASLNIKKKSYNYTGIDLAEGPNVDIVFTEWPFLSGETRFDIVMSCSCFEHDDFFWEVFAHNSNRY